MFTEQGLLDNITADSNGYNIVFAEIGAGRFACMNRALKNDEQTAGYLS
ncbi:MAG: hypothetical protein ACI351_05375 [Candidatus Avelusimicrobium sp.]